MLGWFSRPEDEIFAKNIAQKFERRLPPSVAKSRRDKLNIERLGDIFENILVEAKNYNIKNRPNFIRKARIANIFRWELKSYNYPDEFIATVTNALVIYLSKK